MAARGTDPARGILADPAGDAAFAQNAQGQYGVHPNAEALIEAHRAQQDPALQKASLIQVNAEATEEAKDDLGKAAKKLGLKEGDGELIDVTVRGNALIGVVEYPNGSVGKVVGGWTDDWKPPKLTPEQEAQSVAARSEQEQAREIAQLRVQFQEQLSDRAAELQEEMTSEIQKIREAAQKEVQKAVSAVEKERDESSSRSSGSRSRSTKRSTASRRGRASRTTSSTKPSSSSNVDGPTIGEGVRSPEEKKNETSGA